MFNISLSYLGSFVADRWGLSDARIRPLLGGMTSSVWAVDHPRGRWVAKAVPAKGAREFELGLAIASRLERAGVPAGAPLHTLDGRPAAVAHGWAIALLRRIDGDELTGESEAELRIIGRTLAGVHRALGVSDFDEEGGWPSLDAQADHLAVRPWVRPVVEAGIAGVRRLGPASLTWGPVHGDPAPEAFLLNAETGTCGLIDWGAARSAPRLYDLASAVMYVGGPARAEPLIASYCAAGAIPAAEVARGLLPMLDYRWAAQAYYFAHRIAVHDLTGIDGPAHNDEGLDNARAWWSGRAADLGLRLPGLE